MGGVSVDRAFPADERRAYQCKADGCDSPAVYDVYLHFRYGRRLVAMESLKSSLRVCDRHKCAARDYLLSETNKANISREMAKAGRLGIDWENAMVEFVPTGEAAWGPENMIQLQVGV